MFVPGTPAHKPPMPSARKREGLRLGGGAGSPTLSSSTPCVPSVYTWSGRLLAGSAREAGPCGVQRVETRAGRGVLHVLGAVRNESVEGGLSPSHVHQCPLLRSRSKQAFRGERDWFVACSSPVYVRAARGSPGGSGEASSGSQRLPVCVAPGAWARVRVPAPARRARARYTLEQE